MVHADAAFTDWLRLVRAEYLEVPGLNLTEPQVQRLWGLDPVMCGAVLSELLGRNFLKRTRQGAYMRADQG
jgi:hypothetical protein